MPQQPSTPKLRPTGWDALVVLVVIALAAAAALKLYPALFGLFLLRERRFREIGRTVLYFLLLCLSSYQRFSP